jgi:hypothetical protein
MTNSASFVRAVSIVLGSLADLRAAIFQGIERFLEDFHIAHAQKSRCPELHVLSRHP